MLDSTSMVESFSVTPDRAFAAVKQLAATLWAVEESDVVTATPPTLLVHAVRLDDDVNCWLTWEVAAIDCGSAQVTLRHDDADSRPSPAPELTEVMSALRAQLEASDASTDGASA